MIVAGFTLEMIDILTVQMLERLFLCSDAVLIRDFNKASMSPECPKSISDKIRKGLEPYRQRSKFIRETDQSEQSIYKLNEKEFYDEPDVKKSWSIEELESMRNIVNLYYSNAVDSCGNNSLLTMTPTEARGQLFSIIKSAINSNILSDRDRTLLSCVVHNLNSNPNIATFKESRKVNHGLSRVVNDSGRFKRLKTAIDFRYKIVNEQIAEDVWRKI